MSFHSRTPNLVLPCSNKNFKEEEGSEESLNPGPRQEDVVSG
jgi:hypothetical protein